MNLARRTAPAPVTLSAKGVSIARGGRPVLAGVDLLLAPGDIVLLKGPNGAGKTTLLRALAGLLPCDGEITPDDEEERRAVVIYCGHADGVKAALSVDETLRYWAAVYRAPEASIAAATDTMALRGLERRRAGTLSAGQKRRLGLARLVLARKPIWLLDEPAASIDAASIERFVALVANHAAAGGATLIATHDKLSFPLARSVVIEQAAA